MVPRYTQVRPQRLTMYTAYIMKRTQIYLDESQDERLARRAAAAGTTKSDLIREALDAFLAGHDDDRVRLQSFRAAVRAAAGTASRLPAGSRYVEDLRKADADRSAELDRRRRQ